MTPSKRWVVRPDDGARLGDVLRALGDETAAAEGRAFVDGRRATARDRVSPGAVVEVWPPRDRAALGAASAPDRDAVRILFQRDEVVAAYKPARLATTPERHGDASLLTELARLLGLGPRAPALHAASRLDVGVSGVVLVALGSRGTEELARARAAGRIVRTYAGIAGGRVEGAGTWDWPIGRAGPPARRGAASGGRDAQPARTGYAALGWVDALLRAASGPSARARCTLLRLLPETGRMHQIRIHAAAAGAPLLGDREHGGARAVIDAAGRVRRLGRIALHALSVELPVAGEPMRVAAGSEELRALWTLLGGEPAAWSALGA